MRVGVINLDKGMRMGCYLFTCHKNISILHGVINVSKGMREGGDLPK